MEIRFGQYHLDIDVEKTREFYNQLKTVSEQCDCSGCQNYEKAVEFLSDEIKSFFDTIGIAFRGCCKEMIECGIWCEWTWKISK